VKAEIKISVFTPEKIDNLPKDIQKLVWRALLYKSQIMEYKKEYIARNDDKILEKLIKYCEAFTNMQGILDRKCKRDGLKRIEIV